MRVMEVLEPKAEKNNELLVPVRCRERHHTRDASAPAHEEELFWRLRCFGRATLCTYTAMIRCSFL
jgi:hypothetical protein